MISLTAATNEVKLIRRPGKIIIIDFNYEFDSNSIRISDFCIS